MCLGKGYCIFDEYEVFILSDCPEKYIIVFYSSIYIQYMCIHMHILYSSTNSHIRL